MLQDLIVMNKRTLTFTHEILNISKKNDLIKYINSYSKLYLYHLFFMNKIESKLKSKFGDHNTYCTLDTFDFEFNWSCNL